jgi:hypothetical protein
MLPGREGRFEGVIPSRGRFAAKKLERYYLGSLGATNDYRDRSLHPIAS